MAPVGRSLRGSDVVDGADDIDVDALRGLRISHSLQREDLRSESGRGLDHRHIKRQSLAFLRIGERQVVSRSILQTVRREEQPVIIRRLGIRGERVHPHAIELRLIPPMIDTGDPIRPYIRTLDPLQRRRREKGLTYEEDGRVRSGSRGPAERAVPKVPEEGSDVLDVGRVDVLVRSVYAQHVPTGREVECGSRPLRVVDRVILRAVHDQLVLLAVCSAG